LGDDVFAAPLFAPSSFFTARSLRRLVIMASNPPALDRTDDRG
jgi:hypothetical protein